MKFKELAALNDSEKVKKKAEMELELLKLRAQISQGTVLKSPGQVKQIKKTIARLNTLANKEV